MIVIDGSWTMEGMEEDNPQRLKSSEDLSALINKFGFLPLFKGEIEGFSVEEHTLGTNWWGENPAKDPWAWREVIAKQGNIAYGKLFRNKAGFVSKEWYPIFAAYRRAGYDFDSRYDDGMASMKAKRIYDVLSESDSLPSNELKLLSGFGKGGASGFDACLTGLQMQTYVTLRDFQKRRNKKGEEYGWAVGIYSISENLFGYDYTRSAYHLSEKEALDHIVSHIKEQFPSASDKAVLHNIK